MVDGAPSDIVVFTLALRLPWLGLIFEGIRWLSDSFMDALSVGGLVELFGNFRRGHDGVVVRVHCRLEDDGGGGRGKLSVLLAESALTCR